MVHLYGASFLCNFLFYAVFAEPITVVIKNALAGHTKSSTGISRIAIEKRYTENCN